MANKNIGPYSTSRQPLGTLTTYYQAVLSQKWETDYDVALQKAAQKKQAVLAAFVGLAWCFPCQK